MKHIYIVDEHQSSKQNGVGTYIRQLLKCFEGSGHDVNLLSFNSDEKEFKVERTSFYTEYHFPICGEGRFLSNGALSIALLHLYIPDHLDNIFFVNHSPAYIFLKVLHSQYTKSKVVFVIHDQGWCAPLLGNCRLFHDIIATNKSTRIDKETLRYIQQYTRNERLAYRIANLIITLSQSTYHLLVNTYHVLPNKTYFIRNGYLQDDKSVDCSEIQSIRTSLGIKSDEIVILFTGRTVKSKGILELLQAYEKIWIEMPKLHLIIAGEIFNLNEYTSLTPRSASTISYVGLIKPELIKRWYAIADICVLPSYTEQCSYSGIEMLSYGKMTITTNGFSLHDMFDENTSIIVPIEHDNPHCSSLLVKNLYKAFKKVLALSEEEKNILQENAKKKYNKYFSIGSMKQAYLTLISSL